MLNPTLGSKEYWWEWCTARKCNIPTKCFCSFSKVPWPTTIDLIYYTCKLCTKPNHYFYLCCTCILFLKLFWPTVRKKLIVWSRICKIYEITRTSYVFKQWKVRKNYLILLTQIWVPNSVGKYGSVLDQMGKLGTVLDQIVKRRAVREW